MRRPQLSLVAIALTLCLAGGCASGTSATSRIKTDPAVITRAQIQELRFATAYDAVRDLRGNWLSARGTESFRYATEVQVYVDDVHMGGVAMLQNIASPTIQYIRYFSGLEATARWGLDHGRGVIFVSTKAPLP